MKFIIILNLILAFPYLGRSQEQEVICTSDILNAQRDQLINLSNEIPVYQSLTTQQVANVRKFTDEIVIEVVVHNVYFTSRNGKTEGFIEDIVIHEQIKILNDDFAGKNPNRQVSPFFENFKGIRGEDTKIRFQLKEIKRKGTEIPFWTQCVDEASNCPKGHRNVKFDADGGSNAKESYLNIWVANITPPPTKNGFLAGYASNGTWGLQFDGVVINYMAFGSHKTNKQCHPNKLGGQTLTHEVGHWLGLVHTFGQSCNFGDDCCGLDDYVDDTPKQKEIRFGCNPMDQLNCEGAPIMFMNFMNYNQDDCLFSFTNGQIDRMRHSFLPGSNRHHFLLSQPDEAKAKSSFRSPLPSVERSYVDQDGKLRIDLTSKKQYKDLNGYLIKIKNLDDRKEKKVFIAYNERSLANAQSKPQGKSLSEALKVFSENGLKGTKIDGLKPNANYLFEISTVMKDNSLGDKVRYFYNTKKSINPNTSSKLEVVVSE